MSFSELNQLNNHLGWLQSKQEELRQELSIQNERKSNIESIISNLQRKCALGSEEISRCENKMISDFSEAIKGNQQAGNLAAKVRSKIERNIDGDENLYASWSYIQRELRDIIDRINYLNNEINRVNNEIDSTRVKIRIEKDSIINSFYQEYKNALNRFNTAKNLYSNNPTSGELKSKYYVALNQKNTALNQYNYYKNNL